MTRIFWIEVRRSPLRWVFPLLLLVDLAALFGRSRYWIGVWPQASAAAQIPAQFIGPILAGAAAWTAGRINRRGLTDQTGAAARPMWQAELVQFAATLTYGAAAYLVGIVAAAAVTVRQAGPGFLWPSYLLLGLAVIVGCAAAGHVFGRWSRSRIWPPVISAIASFLLVGWLQESRSFAFGVLSAGPQLQVTRSALEARLACAFAVAAVAVLVPTLAPRARPGGYLRPVQLLAGGTALATLLWALQSLAVADPLRVQRVAVRPLCSTGTPNVCLWPEDRKYLPEIEAMLARIRTLPPGMFVVPSTFFERGLREERRGDDDFEVIEGSLWSISPNFVGSIVNATITTFCPAADAAAEDRRTHAYFELDTWLEARINGAQRPADVHGGPPGVDVAAVGRLIDTPEQQQIEWVRQRLTTIRETPCA
ncbi:hypothetical protein AB0M46_20195 [Dactylosporangium sp. NPDC051485]|uniref:hypothetical protein n=1 Tax=Dactylosporangium sp. NPDC051485 TaxID=3154846 RepID=UPI00342A8F5F